MKPAIAALTSVLVVSAACDPCAGTPSCHMEPEVSYTGQFIEFPTGKAVGGVHVTFVRSGDPVLVSDTIRATSDRDGFFVLRAGALQDGVAEGALTITPPAPHAPYTVPRLRLSTHRKRGDGGFLGRLMVNPYLQFIAELHDRNTFAVVAGAAVTVRAIGAARVEPATSQLTSADNGRFMWEPKVIEFGDLEVEFEVSAAGYPKSYHIRDTISLQYLDEPPRLIVLLVGTGSYVGEVIRRGTKQHLPGVTVEFVRTGGIQAVPDRFTATPDQNGRFDIPMEPVGAGTLIGDLIIRPPAPLPVETVKDVEIPTFDGGKVRLLGPFGYGPATIVRPLLLYRATGLPIRVGTHARFSHVGGLPDVIPAPWGVVPDDGVRIVDSTGVVAYDAATLDSGIVLYDIEVRLNYPHKWETLRAVPIPARYSDKTAVDTFRVGSWFPWRGELRDAETGEPVVGAKVEFWRIGGARVRRVFLTVESRLDGTFPVQPEPLDSGSVNAIIRVRTGGVYRDTIVPARIHQAQDDSIRSIGVIRLTRSQP